MKLSLYLAVVLVSGLAVCAAPEEKPAPLTSSIVEVTVYADRARVTRDASINHKQGMQLYAFTELPGWIDEGSVRASLTPAASGRIADVQVKREYLARATDEEIRAAEAAVQEMSDKAVYLDDELKVLEAQAKQVEAIKVFSLEKLPKDAAVREIDMKSYGDVVAFVADSLRDIAAGRRRIAVQRRELQPELAARQKTLNDLRQMMQLQQTTILVAVEAPAKRLKLELNYMLPGATWEPAHELRAQGPTPESVAFASYAVVTQTTGEDWRNAHISFSTQSPTETISIPELDALLLGSTRAVARLMGGQTDTFNKAQQAYRGQNWLWYNHYNPKESIQNFSANTAYQFKIQDRTARVFKTLQKRGTTAHFQGEGKPAIRSDGRSVRVPMGSLELAARSKIVAAPQASLNAARTVELANTADQPFLPGKVSLYHDGAFLGMTDVDFIAEGEGFSVFLGVADQVKLSRVLDKKNSSMVRGRRTKMQVRFLVTVENLSGEKVSLSLADRVPVSEKKEIEVYKVRIKPEAVPDSKGLLKWELALAPNEKRVHSIEYAIEYPPEVVQQMRKARSSGASPSQQSDLSEQIGDLEVMLQ